MPIARTYTPGLRLTAYHLKGCVNIYRHTLLTIQLSLDILPYSPHESHKKYWGLSFHLYD